MASSLLVMDMNPCLVHRSSALIIDRCLNFTLYMSALSLSIDLILSPLVFLHIDVDYMREHDQAYRVS
jgi:hypothetical protein